MKRWRLAVGAALWTIWMARNDATFNEKKWTAGEIIFTIKLRSWHWFKILILKDDRDETVWWTDPNEMPNQEGSPLGTNDPWQSPAEGWLKFNTDAVVSYRERKADIGGVFRDCKVKIHALFANTWTYEEVDKVELEAIKEALSKAVLLKEQAGKNIVIESDSLVAVSWCLAPTSRPVMYTKTFEAIDKAIGVLNPVVIQHVTREKNTLADSSRFVS